MSRVRKKLGLILLVAILTSNFSAVEVSAKQSMPKPTRSNIMWLAKAMYAENGHARHDATVMLTGVVILQRVKSKEFPNTIKGVLSERGQYSTWRSGKIQRCKPNERCLEIAEEILRFKLWKKYPKNLVYQSMFRQGRSTYKVIDGEYFCLA